MDLQLIPAREGDLPFITEVYNSIVPGGEVTADTAPVRPEDWLPWFRMRNSERYPVFLLSAAGQRCGWMGFSPFKGRPAYDISPEVSIYLHESWRGRGLGRRFLEMGLDEAARRGAKNALAVIFSENLASMRLFTGSGFEEWGRLPAVCSMNGREKDVSILGRRL